jgi:hypothetical protein
MFFPGDLICVDLVTTHLYAPASSSAKVVFIFPKPGAGAATVRIPHNELGLVITHLRSPVPVPWTIGERAKPNWTLCIFKGYKIGWINDKFIYKVQ